MLHTLPAILQEASLISFSIKQGFTSLQLLNPPVPPLSHTHTHTDRVRVRQLRLAEGSKTPIWLDLHPDGNNPEDALFEMRDRGKSCLRNRFKAASSGSFLAGWYFFIINIINNTTGVRCCVSFYVARSSHAAGTDEEHQGSKILQNQKKRP